MTRIHLPHLPDRHDPRLPPDRPPTRAQASRRGVLGGHDRRRRARGDGRRAARRDPRASRSAGAGARRLVDPRVLLLLRPGAGCGGHRGCGARPLRRPRRRRRHGRPRRILHDRPRRRRPRAARDDQVVRLELPLPRARDRARPRGSRSRATGSCARSPRRRRRASRPVRSSSAPSRSCCSARPPMARPPASSRCRSSTSCCPSTSSCSRKLAEAGAEWVQLDEPALVSESIEVPRGTALAARPGRVRRPGRRPPARHPRRRAVRLARRRPAGARPRLRSTPSRLDLVRGAVPAGPNDRQGAGGRGHRRPQHLARRPRGGVRQARGAARGVAERRCRDVDEPVPHPARRRRRARRCRAAEELARLRRPEGRPGGHAGSRVCATAGPPSRTSWMPHPRPWTTAPVRRACATATCAAAPRASTRPPSSRGAYDDPPRRAGRGVRPAGPADDHDRVVPADRRDPARSARASPRARSTRRPTRASSSRRSATSSTCRSGSASTCSCTASPSATTWCSTSPRTSTASRSRRTAGCSRTAPARPARSILWGDVSRPAPITVRWSTFTQSLTEKPVKGMLTGPVTILAWSFVRDDQPLGETANQVALALRDEIADLESAGIGVIQVDEPALRELLPLKKARPARLPRLVGRRVPARDRGCGGHYADPHPPLLLGVRRRARRDRPAGCRRHVDRVGAVAR